MSEDGQKLIAAVRAVAAEQPDLVYTDACQYVVKDGPGEYRPGCLIGHALWRLGMIDSFWYGDSSRNISQITALTKEFRLDTEEAYWLGVAQDEQDAQEPWGVAVRAADDRFGFIR